MAERKNETSDSFNPSNFVFTLCMIDSRLSEIVRDLEIATTAEDTEKVLDLLPKKKVIINEMLDYLGHAYTRTNSEVCDMPEFDPAIDERFLNLTLISTLEIQPHELWPMVFVRLNEKTEEDEERAFRQKRLAGDTSLKVDTLVGFHVPKFK